MKRKLILGTICTLAIGMSLLLSGCANGGSQAGTQAKPRYQVGIGDTINLVKRAESAKQAVEQVANVEDGEQVSVGTAANPHYRPVNRLNITGFEVSCAGTQFTAKWMVDTNYSTIRVQIYADTDMSGEDGVKIGSFDGVSVATEKSFTLTQPLDEGTYYCYIKVTGGDGTPATVYSNTPVEVKIENPEGALENIEFTADEESLYISWAAGNYERYHAILVSDKNSDQIIAETTVVGTQAKFTIPEGVTEFYAAVASYDDGVMGPYRLYKIDLETIAAENPADDANSVDDPVSDVPAADEPSPEPEASEGTGADGK